MTSRTKNMLLVSCLICQNCSCFLVSPCATTLVPTLVWDMLCYDHVMTVAFVVTWQVCFILVPYISTKVVEIKEPFVLVPSISCKLLDIRYKEETWLNYLCQHWNITWGYYVGPEPGNIWKEFPNTFFSLFIFQKSWNHYNNGDAINENLHPRICFNII